jgi:hypothetical protein
MPINLQRMGKGLPKKGNLLLWFEDEVHRIIELNKPKPFNIFKFSECFRKKSVSV